MAKNLVLSSNLIHIYFIMSNFNPNSHFYNLFQKKNLNKENGQGEIFFSNRAKKPNKLSWAFLQKPEPNRIYKQARGFNPSPAHQAGICVQTSNLFVYNGFQAGFRLRNSPKEWTSLIYGSANITYLTSWQCK